MSGLSACPVVLPNPDIRTPPFRGVPASGCTGRFEGDQFERRLGQLVPHSDQANCSRYLTSTLCEGAVRKRPPPKLRPKRRTWTQTPAGRRHAAAAISTWNRKRHLAPKCRAKAKSTGEQCGNVAMSNGVCYLHGGRVGRGDGLWHKPVWPNGDAPDFEAKFQRKLRDQARAEKRRQARIAAMTPKQRDRYFKWRASHAPTSAADRAARRRDRGSDEWLRGVLDRPEKIDPEVAELRAKAEALRAEEAEIRRSLVQFEIP